MLNENEQDAVSKIKAYIDSGHSLDEIRQAGWAPWIDHLEAKGYDLRTGHLALRPPEQVLVDAAPSVPNVGITSGATEPICARCGSYRVGGRPYCKRCGTEWPNGAPAPKAESALADRQGQSLRKHSSNLKWWQIGILVVAGLVVVLVIVGALVGGDSVSVGDEARVYEEGLTTITVGVDTGAFNAIQDAFFAKDFVAIDEMILSGRAYTVSNGTRALVLDRTLTRTKVRFREGPHSGEVGHVLTDWVRPTE